MAELNNEYRITHAARVEILTVEEAEYSRH
jgi:hypothetical protein